MPQTYIVSFVSAAHTNAIINMIKSHHNWGKINNNTWVVVSYNSATEIRDNLKKTGGASDSIFVVRSGAIAAWSNVPASNEWLKKNL